MRCERDGDRLSHLSNGCGFWPVNGDHEAAHAICSGWSLGLRKGRGYLRENANFAEDRDRHDHCLKGFCRRGRRRVENCW